MAVLDLFLKYIKISTASDASSKTVPSTARQLDLARVLVEDMKAIGIARARLENGYVYGEIAATAGCEKAPAIGFIAHMDTATEYSGEGVCANIIKNYDGGDIVLPKSGASLKTADYAFLPSLKGQTLITTDGTTLLGADDKAGIAEILAACDEIIKSGAPHGKICIGFTPDEEIGRGADNFDIKGFGANFAYTVDGGDAGEVVFENFNAAEAVLNIKGFSIHPGTAKGKMINAALVGQEFNAMLPAGEIPAETEGYEGFFHLYSFVGATDAATLKYLIRDHDEQNFEQRKAIMRRAAQAINTKYGAGTLALDIVPSYKNMKQLILPCFHIVENARKATQRAGLEVITQPMRGGTDGGTLTYMGLPCPNLGTGGFNAHGPFELTTVEKLEACKQVIINIVQEYAAQKGV